MCALRSSALTATIASAAISWRLSAFNCNFFCLCESNALSHRPRFTRLKPFCSLKETRTQKQTVHKVSSVHPRFETAKPPSCVDTSSNDGDPGPAGGGDYHAEEASSNGAVVEVEVEMDGEVEGHVGIGGDAALKGTLLAGLVLVGVVGGLGSVGYIYKDQINAFLVEFSDILEGYGPAGYALFVAVYAGLE
ncbi:hypothetical protein KI387_016980, partial [Taxus chinensis]